MFHIDTEEFEQERRVFDMWDWINAKLAEMETFPEFDSIYFKQKGIVKKLIEEAIPIARLGMHLLDQMKEVFIRCHAGNQNYDATLRLTGFNDSVIKVEATTTQTKEVVDARRQLAEHGFTHRPARFQTNDKGIRVIVPEMVDMLDQCDEWVEAALKAAEAKLKWNSYDKNTAILVRVDTWRPIPLSVRAELVAKSRQRFEGHLADVYDLYYLHMNGIDSTKHNDF